MTVTATTPIIKGSYDYTLGQIITRLGLLGTASQAAVLLTTNQTIAGVKTFTSDPVIPDEVYGAGWNGVLEPPTKNAVYDKIEAVIADYVPDTGDTTIAGVKTFSSDPIIPDEPYGSGWNGSLEPVTKNALYDLIINLLGNGLMDTIVVWTDNMSDDTVWTYDFGTDIYNGNVTVVSNNGSHRGLFGIRTTATSFCSAIGTATGITGTTGALTGTTGVDGTVTISTHTDNKLYIENRSGGTRHFDVTISTSWLNAAP